MRAHISRRDFLQAAGVGALAFGLTACSTSSGGNTTDEDADSEDNSRGITLDQAKALDSQACHYFVHRTDGYFYPLEHGLITGYHTDRALYAVFYDEYNFAYCQDPSYKDIDLSAGDELVYIASDSYPSVPPEALFTSVKESGYTLPIVFGVGNEVGTSNPDMSLAHGGGLSTLYDPVERDSRSFSD